MIRTMDIMSAAPVMNVFTICFSDRPPTIPMTIAMTKNHVEASSKYHWPMGRPVTTADQAWVMVLPSASYTPLSKKACDVRIKVAQRDEADDHDDEGESENAQNGLLTTSELDLLGGLGGSCAMGGLGVPSAPAKTGTWSPYRP